MKYLLTHNLLQGLIEKAKRSFIARFMSEKNVFPFTMFHDCMARMKSENEFSASTKRFSRFSFLLFRVKFHDFQYQLFTCTKYEEFKIIDNRMVSTIQ